MIDPISAIAIATSAFNGIKQAISVGRDLQDMGSSLSKFATAVSDIDFAHQKAEKPPWYKKLAGVVGATQSNAMEIWMHKQKAKEMREELRSYISLYYGPSAWNEIVAIEVQMRKAQKEAVYAAEELKETIVGWVVGIIATVVLGGGFGYFLYWLGAANGKW